MLIEKPLVVQNKYDHRHTLGVNFTPLISLKEVDVTQTRRPDP